MGSEVRIRLARPDDAPALAKLRWLLRTEVGAPVEEREAFVARCEPWFAAAAVADDWLVWVADAGGAAAGMVALHVVPKVPNPAGVPESLGYLTSFYVVPERRNGGIGSALLGALVAAARERGCESVVLWPTPQSVALYRRFGFETPRRALELRLGD